MPINHRKRWTLNDLKKIKQIANSLKTKKEMYQQAPQIASMFGRTIDAVCKKIEEENKWFWAAR